MQYSYDYFQSSADYLKSRVPFVPEIAIILGSSLGSFGSQLENSIEVDYKDIPNFLVSTVKSHAGKMIFGTICNKKVVCMSGRFHYYEGYDFEQLVIPIRVLKLLGVEQLLLTNASGAVNPDYAPGDVMIIKDHIKLYGSSPMRGPNIAEFGPRFFDVSEMYTPKLRELALSCAKDSGLKVHEGVYMFFPGPQFETPAEIRAAHILGADAIGMSTVTEALTAAHCQMPMLAIAVITNMAAGVEGQPCNTAEVGETARGIADRFGAYVKTVLSQM